MTSANKHQGWRAISAPTDQECKELLSNPMLGFPPSTELQDAASAGFSCLQIPYLRANLSAGPLGQRLSGLL